MKMKKTGSITLKEVIALIENKYKIKIKNAHCHIKYVGGNAYDIGTTKTMLDTIEFDMIPMQEYKEMADIEERSKQEYMKMKDEIGIEDEETIEDILGL